MEKNLTSGSVLKSILFFFTALSAFVLFADAVRHGGSVVLAAVLVGLVDPIVRIVSTPEQAVAGTRTYLIICFIGVPCITAYNIMASIFRGLGDSRSPMYFIVAGLCLASLAVVNEKEYILVTLGAPGNHATEQTNIMDAVQVYRRLEKKK